MYPICIWYDRIDFGFTNKVSNGVVMYPRVIENEFEDLVMNGNVP